MLTPRSKEWSWYTAGVELYAAMVRARVPFAQANYGDGEWACILGRDGKNVNGEVYARELRERLVATLQHPTGQWYGWNPGTETAAAEKWLRNREIDLPWVWKDYLSSANVNGALGPFLAACKTRLVTVIGPAHLADVGEDVLGAFDHIVVPDSTAWREADAILERLKWEPTDLVLCAAGMGSNLIVHGLWKRRAERNAMLPNPHTVLDIGACLDPYAGVNSRKGYRKPEFADAMARNLS